MRKNVTFNEVIEMSTLGEEAAFSFHPHSHPKAREELTLLSILHQLQLWHHHPDTTLPPEQNIKNIIYHNYIKC